MAITDKTRKILWARSGNRCAICRQTLVIEKTNADAEAVVGDECHINSGAPDGPRHDPAPISDLIDHLENLLLLCRVHHKMVDDQPETYTAELLRAIKSNHEAWVESKFIEAGAIPPIRWRRFKNEIPKSLKAIKTGPELFKLLSTCQASYQDYPDDLRDFEVDMVGDFLQNLKDWVDLAGDLEPFQAVRAATSLTEEIAELNAHGFMVFAARERQQLTGGIGAPFDFYVLHVSIARNNDPTIISQ